MEEQRLALIGFGNVGQALGELLLHKAAHLERHHGLRYRVVAIATGSHGSALAPGGLDLSEALRLAESGASLQPLSADTPPVSAVELIARCGADVLFENTPVDYQTGEPALSHLRGALQRGMHAITANKGPVVHGHESLQSLAKSQNKAFLFESTVMDGAPIFSLWRSCLPGARIESFRGILNSTTNLILGLQESGMSFDDAVAHAQSIGIAETDPSGDLEGWDAAIKVAILATVLMDRPTLPAAVERQGIDQLKLEEIQAALEAGDRWKLVCSAQRHGEAVRCRVAPERLSVADPLYAVSGTSSALTLQTDVLGDLTIAEEDPGPETTAYGLLADFLSAVL